MNTVNSCNNFTDDRLLRNNVYCVVVVCSTPNGWLNLEWTCSLINLDLRRLRFDLIYVYKILFGIIETDVSALFVVNLSLIHI